tara:strand:- start:175 stop:1938 length:1764 start_codon:yes stop_codon:yes gene_type:complete
MYPINEDNIDLMRKAAGGAAQTVKMKDGKLQMDMFTASAIMKVFDKVNPANQKKMAVMINKGTKDGMMKLQDFAMKQVKSENDPEIEEEVDLDEAILKDRDYEVDEKEGVVKISKKNFAKVSKDAKGTDKSKPTMMVLTKKGTSLYPVKFTEEVDLDEASPNKQKSDVIVMKKDNSEKSVVGASGVKKAEKDGYKIQYALLAPYGKKVTDPKGIMKAIKGGDKLGIGEEVDLDEDFSVEVPKQKIAGKTYGGGATVIVKAKTASQAIKMVAKRLGVDVNLLKTGKVVKEEVDLDEAIKVGDNVKVKLSRKGREYIEKGKVTEIEKDSIIVKHDFSRTPSKVKMTDIVKEEADLDEGKSDFEVKYAKSKGGPIKVTKFVQYDQARKFLHNLKKDGMNGIISKDGKPVKEEADLDENRMSQLHQMIKDKKSAAEIAKEMKLDVKTVKALMNSHHPEDIEESAASDARRAMSRDKDFSRRDTADDDTGATDADVKGASKNIIMQLRKAGNRASMGVEFGDGKKVQIPAKMALAVQQKYNSLKKPADKEKFQAQIAKSYKDMLKVLKSGYGEQKESILERMNRKIKENKDG